MKQKESYDDDEAGRALGQLANGSAHGVVAAISRLGVIRCAVDLQRRHARLEAIVPYPSRPALLSPANKDPDENEMLTPMRRQLAAH
jgi:hypothetical protein